MLFSSQFLIWIVKNIIFLGSKYIGLDCLKYLFYQRIKYDYTIIGVLTNKRGKEIREYCLKNDILLLNSLSELLSMENIDIGI